MVLKYILRAQLQPLRAAAANLDEKLVVTRIKYEVIEKYKSVFRFFDIKFKEFLSSWEREMGGEQSGLFERYSRPTKIIPFTCLACSPHQKSYCVKHNVVTRYNKMEEIDLIIIRSCY